MRTAPLLILHCKRKPSRLKRLKPVWNDRSISLSSKMRSLVTSIFLYAYESWTLTAQLQRIQAMEMRCYRKILLISYKDHVKNEEGSTKAQQAIRPPDHRKEMQTAVIWTCPLFITSGKSHLARHSGRGKKTRQTEKLERQH